MTCRRPAALPFSVVPSFIVLVASMVMLTACENAQFRAREKGALAGGAMGAGLGAIIGHETGATGAGVAIGSAVGALTGGLIGNEFDAQEDRLNDRERRMRSNEEIMAENERLIRELKARGADVYNTDRGVIVNLPDVLFEFNKSRLTRDAYRVVTEISGVLKGVESRRISVEGHTDSIGTLVYNQRLSEARANTVANELTRQGISRRRISTRGFGEARPIASNGSSAGRARNRRVEIVVENR